MVAMKVHAEMQVHAFQYSLCRVVLMVPIGSRPHPTPANLSVLALSSRFDGRVKQTPAPQVFRAFSTRSVESF